MNTDIGSRTSNTLKSVSLRYTLPRAFLSLSKTKRLNSGFGPKFSQQAHFDFGGAQVVQKLSFT